MNLLADAWAWWQRERSLLLAIAGPFLFLPAYAIALLVPPAPAGPIRGAGQAETAAWITSFGAWMGANSPWYLAHFALNLFGTFAMLVLLLDPRGLTVGEALAQAARRYGRLLLASLIMAGATVLLTLPFALLAGAALPMALFLLLLPSLYVMARMILVYPGLAADPRLSATTAVGQSVASTRGHVLGLVGVVLILTMGGMLAGEPFTVIDGWLRRAGAAGLLSRAIVDAVIAGVATLGALAHTMVQVAAYRRFGGAVSSGT